MLLRNYDNIVAAYSLVSTGSGYEGDTTTFGDSHLNAKTIEAYLREISLTGGYLPMKSLYASTASQQTGTSWIRLGSGTTPVTYDDYKLENELSTSQIAVNSASALVGAAVYDEQTKTWTRTTSYDFQAKSDITVSEIGVVYHLPCRYAYEYCLVYREVLDTPVSLTTGQYLKVSITTTVSANPNKPADVSATVETV